MSGAPELAPLELTVPAGDGLALKGTLRYPTGAPSGAGFPLAVLAHQYPATRDSYAPLVSDLLALRIATLAFDLRGHGTSIAGPDGLVVIDAPATSGPEAFGRAFMSSIERVELNRIDDDIVRVCALGMAQNFVDGTRLALVGASIGGSAALLAAPLLPGIRAVATLGAAGAPAFGDDAGKRIRAALSGAIPAAYLASSAEDPFDGGANVRSWGNGLTHVTTRIVPGKAHAMAIYYEVRDEMLRFMKASLA